MATYYVDVRNGDDANGGLQPDQAWRSLERVNDQALQPADVVLLKAGDVHHTTLSPRGSGTATDPITFGRYGEGPSPVLSGLRDLTAAPWVEVDGESGVWRTGFADAGSKGPEKLLLDGEAWSPRAASLDAMARPGDWFWDEEQIYLQSSMPPGQAYETIAAPSLEQAIRVKERDHLRFENLEIVGAVQGVLIDDSVGTVLVGLDVHHNTRNGIHLREASGTIVSGGSIYANGIDGVGDREIRLGHGILIGRGSTENAIENVVLFGNAEDGVQFGPQSGDGNLVRSSLIFANREDGIDIKQGSQNVFATCVMDNAENAILVHKSADEIGLSGNVLRTRTGGNALDVSDAARIVSHGNWYQGAASHTLQLHPSAGDRSEFSGDVFLGGGQNAGVSVVVAGGVGHRFDEVTFAADGVDHLLWLRRPASASISGSVMHSADSKLLRLDEGVELTLTENLYAGDLGHLLSEGDAADGESGASAVALDGEGRTADVQLLLDEGRWPVQPPIDCRLPDEFRAAAATQNLGLADAAFAAVNDLVFVVGGASWGVESCTGGHECHTLAPCGTPFGHLSGPLGDC